MEQNKVMYEIMCKAGAASYIGETKRELSVRIQANTRTT